MAIPKKVRELLEKLLVGEETAPGRSYALAPLMEMLRDDEMTKEDKAHLMRYYNFRKPAGNRIPKTSGIRACWWMSRATPSGRLSRSWLSA